MIILLVAICAAAAIAAYAILRITDWFEKRANKKFPAGKFKEE